MIVTLAAASPMEVVLSGLLLLALGTMRGGGFMLVVTGLWTDLIAQMQGLSSGWQIVL